MLSCSGLHHIFSIHPCVCVCVHADVIMLTSYLLNTSMCMCAQREREREREKHSPALPGVGADSDEEEEERVVSSLIVLVVTVGSPKSTSVCFRSCHFQTDHGHVRQLLSHTRLRGLQSSHTSSGIALAHVREREKEIPARAPRVARAVATETAP